MNVKALAHVFLFVASHMLLSACGFHLRGLDQAVLPAELAELRLLGPHGAPLARDELYVAMREALATQGGARLSESAGAPALILYTERVATQVLSVGTSGKVNEYLLRYELDFRLTDSAGRERLALQTVRLQRGYTFDPLNVLAKEREERDLLSALRREAAAQVVRRLSKVRFE